jgi:molybdopterin-guanine dinucleotide biosynthesis protein A
MVAGLLLTGGASTRMGVDKAALVVAGERLADRAARVLGAVCLPMIEVGPGYAGLETVLEEPPGTGPLAALAAGGAALRHRDHPGPAIVLAVDLPLVTADFLRFLATYPGQGTVVPFVAGEPQPVCARYSAVALLLAAEAIRSGERSIRAFLPAVPDLQWAGPRMWGHVADERTLADVDTPEDLRRLGLDADLQGGVEQ